MHVHAVVIPARAGARTPARRSPRRCGPSMQPRAPSADRSVHAVDARRAAPDEPAQGEAVRAGGSARRTAPAVISRRARRPTSTAAAASSASSPSWRRPGLRSARTAISPSISPSTRSPVSSWPCGLESELGLSVEDGDLAAAATVGELLQLVEAGRGRVASCRVPVLGAPAPGPCRPRLPAGRHPAPAHAVACRRSGSTAWSTSTASSHLSFSSPITRATSTPRPSCGRCHAGCAPGSRSPRPPTTSSGRGSSPWRRRLLLNAFPFSREGSVARASSTAATSQTRGGRCSCTRRARARPTVGCSRFGTGIGLLATGPARPGGADRSSRAPTPSCRRSALAPARSRHRSSSAPRCSRRRATGASRQCPSRAGGRAACPRPDRSDRVRRR